MAKSRRGREIDDLSAIYEAIRFLERKISGWDAGERYVVKCAYEAYDRISERLKSSVPYGPADAR